MDDPDSGSLLQVWTFFCNDRAFNRTNLHANSTVDAGVEIDPIKVCSLLVFAIALIDAGHWASVDAIGDAFAHISNDAVSHGDSSAVGRILEIEPIQLHEGSIALGMTLGFAAISKTLQAD